MKGIETMVKSRRLDALQYVSEGMRIQKQKIQKSSTEAKKGRVCT